MNNDTAWEEAVEGVKRLKTNRYIEERKPQSVSIRKDKLTTVTFEQIKTGKNVEKDDLSQMDGALARRFRREEFKTESTLDLHGFTEKEAFEKVTDFIKSAYNSKKRCVLIITGKGIGDTPFCGKGILRKAVPSWLSHSEISPLILAYKNPSEALGGTGALYILLRKNNKKGL